ncbi:MAG: hypothetical protein ACJAWY_000858 [Sphingomonas echinoides]|jgi:hypothetical protein
MIDAPAFEYARYPTAGGEEWMILRGPRDGPRVLILQPILNEANQCRAMVVDFARHLALAGVGSAIPDLPGTGESTRPLAEVRWSDWRDAVAAAAATLRQDSSSLMVASLRGGALIDDVCGAESWWRFAESSGAALLRPLERAQRLTRSSDNMHAPNDIQTLAGFSLHRELLHAFRAAAPEPVPRPLRAVAFDGVGTPVWRRAEPTNDPALAKRLAEDFLAWISACER